MTASGDPQKMGQARTAIFGAIGGLVIVGVAFMAPRIISEFVIEPAGGQVIGGDGGVSCDGILQAQLLVQRGASTATRMNQVIGQIQAQRDECPEDVWQPEVVERAGSACFGSAVDAPGLFGAEVGDTVVPRSLRKGNTDGVAALTDGQSGTVRITSGRDSDNNILVYWSDDATKRPTDSSTCWLYSNRIRTWDENY